MENHFTNCADYLNFFQIKQSNTINFDYKYPIEKNVNFAMGLKNS